MHSPARFIFNEILFSILSVLPECMCIICALGNLGGQKRALVPLELELQMTNGCELNVGAGNQTQVFWSSSHLTAK